MADEGRLFVQLTERESNTQVAVLRGEMDVVGAEGLAESLVSADAPIVIADLSGVTFIDSSGIAELIAARRHLESQGRSFLIRGARPIVLTVFRALGMTDWLEGE